MKRDKKTDWELVALRGLFNAGKHAELRERALLMSDWLEDRGRLAEATALRSGQWQLLIHAGHGWPPPCIIVGEYVPGTSSMLYLDSAWVAAAEALEVIANNPDAEKKGAALLDLLARAVAEKFPMQHQGDGEEVGG